MTLVFSLLAVLVGGALFFHLEHTENTSFVTVMAGMVEVAHDHDDCASSNTSDPCAKGHCHLGHCASLVFSISTVPNFVLEQRLLFFSRVQKSQDRYLEGPFQPPRAA